jgi:hypothetical protein
MRPLTRDANRAHQHTQRSAARKRPLVALHGKQEALPVSIELIAWLLDKALATFQAMLEQGPPEAGGVADRELVRLRGERDEARQRNTHLQSALRACERALANANERAAATQRRAGGACRPAASPRSAAATTRPASDRATEFRRELFEAPSPAHRRRCSRCRHPNRRSPLRARNPLRSSLARQCANSLAVGRCRAPSEWDAHTSAVPHRCLSRLLLCMDRSSGD